MCLKVWKTKLSCFPFSIHCAGAIQLRPGQTHETYRAGAHRVSAGSGKHGQMGWILGVQRFKWSKCTGMFHMSLQIDQEWIKEKVSHWHCTNKTLNRAETRSGSWLITLLYHDKQSHRVNFDPAVRFKHVRTSNSVNVLGKASQLSSALSTTFFMFFPATPGGRAGPPAKTTFLSAFTGPN